SRRVFEQGTQTDRPAAGVETRSDFGVDKTGIFQQLAQTLLGEDHRVPRGMKSRPANSKQIPLVTVCIRGLALKPAAWSQDRKNLPHGFERIGQVLDDV